MHVEFARGQPDKALTLYSQAAESAWDRQLALKTSRAHTAAGDGREREPLRRWIQENPDDGDVRLAYGQILESSGDVDAAVGQYEILVEQGKANAVVLNNLAWQYAQQGRDDAVSLAEQAHELDPDNGSITDTLAWIIFEDGDVERALPLLKEAVSQSPDNLEVKFHLASALASAGENEDASAIIQELLDSGLPFPSKAEAERLAMTL